MATRDPCVFLFGTIYAPYRQALHDTWSFSANAGSAGSPKDPSLSSGSYLAIFWEASTENQRLVDTSARAIRKQSKRHERDDIKP